MCLWVRELELVRFWYFLLKEDSVVDEESHLEVRVRGQGNTETSWKWGSQEWGQG